MDRITSERIRSAEQHAQTLLKSLEQLKEGSVGTLLSNELSSLTRKSLPRRAKDYKKDSTGNGDAVTDKSPCSCGNPTSCKCSMSSSPGKRRSARREKNTKTYFYESGDSSSETSDGEEDIPLVTLRKRRRTADETTTNNVPRDGSGSGSSDDEWTPFGSSKKRKEKRRKGEENVLPSLVTQSTNSTSLRVPAISQHHVISAPSQHGSSYLNLPSLHSTRPALTSSRPSPLPSSRHSFPSNRHSLPSSRDQHLLSRLWQHPGEQVIRLQGVTSNLYSNKVSGSFVPLSYENRSPGCEKRSPSREKRPLGSEKHIPDNVKSEKSKEKTTDNNILMFYARFPRSQYCDQKRLVDLFRPYCTLSYIQWMDKRSAVVTINDDSTFHTYDNIYINLMMRSEYENDNLVYVGSYDDYIKRNESVKNHSTSNM